MKLIQRIFKDHSEAYIRTNGSSMHGTQHKALEAVVKCRTPASGIHVFECPDCKRRHVTASSCGNRHCPICQNPKAAAWVHRQQLKGLPCHYFLVTFTMPTALHAVARNYPRQLYSALFYASSAALRSLETDRRFVGCTMAGFFGILHPWGRQMQYHPHIHYVVPGGGLSEDRKSWITPKGDFLVHVRALSALYKGKLKAELARCDLLKYVPESAWGKRWVVHCKAVGDGQRALKYLGAYVFRVAMSNARIINYDGRTVTFRYRKTGSRRPRRCSLDAMEFIRRFLQHVLPEGFMKIRHYGFMHARCKVTVETIRKLITRAGKDTQKFVPPPPPARFKPLRCDQCGGIMQWKRFISPREMAMACGGP